jgi:DNA-binding GntR family transcriptional regulator
MNENDTRMPYYAQVAETLRRRIMTDEYTEGSLIPSVEGLEKEFGVSNITIRKALEMLTRDGLLLRKRGVGTVVQKCERDLVVFELSGSFERLVKSVENLPLELEVLDMAIVPCPLHVQQAISIRPDQDALRIKKLRRHGGSPLSFYVHYTDPAFGGTITKEKVEAKHFVHVFEEVSNVKVASLDQRLESVIADIDLSRILEVRFGSPLIFVENVYCADQHKPVILTQNYYRGDKCSYRSSAKL